LEFHLPYFTLRKSEPPKDGNGKTTAIRPLLKTLATKSENEIRYAIDRAQFSFTICGSDHSRWVGYAFVKDDHEDELEDEDDADASNDLWRENPIMLGKADAKHPIWDPRAYFLVVLEIRTAKALDEWKYLVRNLQRAVDGYVCCFPSSNITFVNCRTSLSRIRQKREPRMLRNLPTSS
jgi:hypothetical protein